MHESVRCCRIVYAALIVAIVFIISQAIGPDGRFLARSYGMEEQVHCYQTQSPGLCGTNMNLGGVTCGTGQPTCYSKVILYGPIFNCAVAQSGLTGCAAGQCQKFEYDFECNQELEICVLKKTYPPFNVVPTSFASGNQCTPKTDPDPGGGGGIGG